MATEQALYAYMKTLSLKLNKKEQFFLYAGDHGNTSVKELQVPIKVPALSIDTEAVDVPSDLLETMVSSSDNSPFLRIEYTGLTALAPVSFNSVLLGFLDPFLEVVELDLPKHLIAPENIIEIENRTDTEFVIESKELFHGNIGLIRSTPEPQSYLILLAGICGLGFRELVARRRATRRTQPFPG